METVSIDIFLSRDGECFISESERDAYDATLSDDDVVRNVLAKWPELANADS